MMAGPAWYVSCVSHTSTTVVLGDRGRLVLPAAVREQLGLEAGAKLSLVVEDDGTIRLRSLRAIVDAGLGMFAHLGEPGVSMVDELIRERREEAAREDAER